MEKFNPNKKDWEPLCGFEEPKITCPACGNPNIKAHRVGGVMEISCSKCGTILERPIIVDATPLENVVDLINEYEQIRYKVNKSKED